MKFLYFYYLFFIQVNFGRDFEQQLNFFVEARATFSNLDSVLVMLVQVCGIIFLNFNLKAGKCLTKKKT